MITYMKYLISSGRWRWLLGSLALIIVMAPRVAHVYVNSLWFGSLGYASVYWSFLWIKSGLFVGFFGLTLLILRGAFWALERAYAGYHLEGAITRFDNQLVEVEPARFIKPLAWGVSLVWGILIGLVMVARWELFVLYFNGSPGNEQDPIFGRPLGFFLFTWPVYQMLASWLSGLAIIIFLGTLLYGFFAFISHMPAILKNEALRVATVACSLALVCLLGVYAWRFHLGRFSQLWRERDIFTGVGYTEAHILLPGLSLMAFVLLGAAGIAVLNAMLWRRGYGPGQKRPRPEPPKNRAS